MKKHVNRCSRCGKFRPWAALKFNYYPDAYGSSEDQSYYRCVKGGCA